MASFVQIENLTKSYGDRLLFADLTFGIEEGEKIGLVARNGTGKTTLLRCIAGAEDFDSGKVTFRKDLHVGYLEQTPRLDDAQTVLEACLNHDTPLTRAVSTYEAAVASGDTEAITAASSAMDALQAWGFEEKLMQILGQLGIEKEASRRIGELSGGQKKRVALARVLIEEPDFLILDEPTNHLDLESVEWIESYLTRSKVTLLMVTHDRWFLDRICNRIIEMDRGDVYSHNGNYAYYLRRRAERLEAASAEVARVRNVLRREQEWMNRQPQARAGKAKYRIDNFYDLKERSRCKAEEGNINLAMKSSYIGNKIFEAREVSKSFGDKKILDHFSYIFSRYEKVGLVGRSGVGKTTFIRMLLGLEPTDSGSWDIGDTVRFGYYSQDGISFPAGKKVIEVIEDIAEDVVLNDGKLRLSPMQFLTRFLFSPADQQKYVEKLSGGEKSRLHLAMVLMRSPNFLILDEPTNDLDIDTLNTLEEYIAEFKGCVLVVTHDRCFLDNVADHLFVLEGDGTVKDFPGTYSEYRAWKAEQESARKEQEAAELPAQQQPKPSRSASTRAPRLTFKERKELETLEQELEALNAEKQQIEHQFNNPAADTDINALSIRYNQLKDELDEKELRWLELSDKEQG